MNDSGSERSSSSSSNLSTNSELLPHESSLLSDALGYEAEEVYILNKPTQCLLISLIILIAIVCNSLVIHNIWKSQLKMRTVNFLLIKNLCIVDLIGAFVVLPFPLVATAKGQWDFGDAMCTANSIVNVALWFQHIVMFAMLKIDRVLASCLPFGKYPLLGVEAVTGIVIATWVFSFFVAGLVTAVYKSAYEPAVVLCIPELPIGFFITIFSVYCMALFGMVGGYIVVLICLKKKQAHIQNTNAVQATDYKGLERAALTSFLITISHFLLYVPTMLVIGLHGWFLHPIAILCCDMVVYSEFLIHPVVLLSTSTKMRQEIKHTLYRLCQDIISFSLSEIYWYTKTILFKKAVNKDQMYAVRSPFASNVITEVSRSPICAAVVRHKNNDLLRSSNNKAELTSVVIHEHATARRSSGLVDNDDDHDVVVVVKYPPKRQRSLDQMLSSKERERLIVSNKRHHSIHLPPLLSIETPENVDWLAKPAVYLLPTKAFMMQGQIEQNTSEGCDHVEDELDSIELGFKDQDEAFESREDSEEVFI